MTIRRAIVATRTFAPEGNAAAYRLAALASALRDAGTEVTVLTTSPRGGAEPSEGVHRWPVLRDRTGAVRGYLPYASFDIPLFFRLLFARRADVVVVEPPPTTGVAVRLAAGIRRMPYVYFSADVTTTAAQGIGVHPAVVAVLRRVEGWVLRGAVRVLAVSDGVRDEVVGLGASPDRVAVVGTGIDTSAFSTDGPVHDEAGPYLVYGGTMSEIQGAGIFVDAFALIATEHPDARLLMFGGGVEIDELTRRATEVGDGRIELHGLVGADELAPVLRGARACLASVRPGRGYDFAFATKALVGLSCGTPVVYAGVGPLATWIRDENLGWAVDWEPRAVADAMRAALSADRRASDRERRAAWVQNRYSVGSVSRTAVEAITTAVAGRPTDPAD